MKSFLVIGAGRYGKQIALQLNQQNQEVMAVDLVEERISEILPYVTSAQIGDSTNIEFLRSLGVRNFDVCIVTIGTNFESSLETTSNLKELGAAYVVAIAERDVSEKFLLRNGADEVLYPQKQIAKWAAIRYASNHILDFIKVDDENAIFEVPVPKDWLGRTIGQIDIRKKYNINIMAIKKDGTLKMSISSDTVLTEDLTMLVFGEYKALQKCFHL